MSDIDWDAPLGAGDDDPEALARRAEAAAVFFAADPPGSTIPERRGIVRAPRFRRRARAARHLAPTDRG